MIGFLARDVSDPASRKQGSQAGADCQTRKPTALATHFLDTASSGDANHNIAEHLAFKTMPVSDCFEGGECFGGSFAFKFGDGRTKKRYLMFALCTFGDVRAHAKTDKERQVSARVQGEKFGCWMGLAGLGRKAHGVFLSSRYFLNLVRALAMCERTVAMEQFMCSAT